MRLESTQGVMVHFEGGNLSPTHWKMARMVETAVSPNGKVCNVFVKTENETWPVQKFCLLPVDAAGTSDPRPVEAAT